MRWFHHHYGNDDQKQWYDIHADHMTRKLNGMQEGKRRSQMVANLRSRREGAVLAGAWATWRDFVTERKERLAAAEQRWQLYNLEVMRTVFIMYVLQKDLPAKCFFICHFTFYLVTTICWEVPKHSLCMSMCTSGPIYIHGSFPSSLQLRQKRQKLCLDCG